MRKQKVSNEDKSMYIAGTMALALFTFLTLCGVFIAQALGVGILAGIITHIFFSEYYYKIKDWMLSANSKQSEFNQNIQLNLIKIYGGSQLWLKKLKIWRRKN